VKSYPQQDWKWTESDYNALLRMWDKESNWNHKAHNKSSSTYNGTDGSGAYGIPQAMPGSKMKSEGGDWLTNPVPQIHWGLKYIKGRYGTPEAAWAFWQSHKWY
jgi:SLT domain-containing protein